MTTTENQIPEAQIRLPFNSYKVRVLKCEKKIAKSGSPMLVQECEIFESPNFTQDGVSVNPNGINLTAWISLQSKMIDQINSNRKALGLSAVKVADIGNINPDDYPGQTGAVIAVSKAEDMVNDVTGEPITNPNTGKVVQSWNKRITQWLARE